jgi:hypothetical protein
MLLNERLAQYWRTRGNYGSYVEHKEKGAKELLRLQEQGVLEGGLFTTARGWGTQWEVSGSWRKRSGGQSLTSRLRGLTTACCCWNASKTPWT